ncbi:MAG TPA: anti-sigma regulatory factor [Bacteroidales bacterium]|jgi:serine/threonine-protein kinase RsbT|nr:serine/threonine-protein kinase RsbT [Rikenellaceae bacterium]HCM29517.1 anti-sigma regulatory factor [Bacteroidales bacterium]HOV55747.1 anti-sigma regulatory factor [Bacteroidales bacterium]HRC79171.1 anti-sigma regulatory factor [Bacteroidales bacterium]
MILTYKIQGGDFSNAGKCSSEVKKVLKQLNIDHKIIKKVVIALYEGEVNIVAHAYHGVITVEIDTEKIQITFKDEGPGIPDINKAMEQGYSTASPIVRELGFGAGMGLPNMKKNTDYMHINSQVNKGTEVILINYL